MDEIKDNQRKYSFSVQKRDGSVVAFDEAKIAVAVGKALAAAGQGEESDASFLASQVAARAEAAVIEGGDLGVEKIQDLAPNLEARRGR